MMLHCVDQKSWTQLVAQDHSEIGIQYSDSTKSLLWWHSKLNNVVHTQALFLIYSIKKVDQTDHRQRLSQQFPREDLLLGSQSWRKAVQLMYHLPSLLGGREVQQTPGLGYVQFGSCVLPVHWLSDLEKITAVSAYATLRFVFIAAFLKWLPYSLCCTEHVLSHHCPHQSCAFVLFTPSISSCGAV